MKCEECKNEFDAPEYVPEQTAQKGSIFSPDGWLIMNTGKMLPVCPKCRTPLNNYESKRMSNFARGASVDITNLIFDSSKQKVIEK